MVQTCSGKARTYDEHAAAPPRVSVTILPRVSVAIIPVVLIPGLASTEPRCPWFLERDNSGTPAAV